MKWTLFKDNLTREELGDLRDREMCCFNIYNTVQLKFCTLCRGYHPMMERRFECGSVDCYRAAVANEKARREEDLFSAPTKPAFVLEAPDSGEEIVVVPKLGGKKSCCPAIWKVQHCTVRDLYQASINDGIHTRGCAPCTVVSPPQLTDELRAYILREDKKGSTPRQIYNSVQSDPSVKEPRRGWPTPKQIANASKYLRAKFGTKNSIAAVEKLVREWTYAPNLDPKKVILFGPFLDDDGHVHVGTGEDDDPLNIGLTTVALLENCAKYMSPDQPTIFHADATFKLSDLGYPVITCGFTDQARSYQLAAIFVVSRRTTLDYMQCFSALMARFRDIRARSPKIEFVMGDAEDAQYNAIHGVPELGGSTVLMCFFHVLYNVRKKIQHMGVSLRKTVIMGIMEMHFSSDLHEFLETRDRVLQQWRSKSGLAAFSKYFDNQWLTGRYWRWQAFHTPLGYAVTNNPCEIFNASIKSYFRRRRCHMEMLLDKLSEVINVSLISPPVSAAYIPTPSTDVSTAAKLMLQAGKIKIIETESKDIIRVCHVSSRRSSTSAAEGDTPPAHPNPSASQEDHESDDDAAFMDAFDSNADEQQFDQDGRQHHTTKNEEEKTFTTRSRSESDVTSERERESARKLYDNAVKWSIKYSHRLGQPEHGWTVDLVRCVCNCRFFAKFAMCAHVAAGRQAKRLPKPGVEVPRLFKSRIVGKKKASKAAAAKKAKKGGQTAAAAGAIPDVNSSGDSSISHSPLPIVGRPPLAARALEVQFLLN